MTPHQQRPFNILFTSAGRRVELLRSFRRAYDELNLSGNRIAVDIDPLAPVFQTADVCYRVPRLDDPEYIQVLVSICRREQVDLIVPLIDPDVPILAKHRQIFEMEGAKLAVISSESAEIVGDKWATFNFFRRFSLPTPTTWLPHDPALRTQSFPLFVKPRRGSASQQTFKVNNWKELEFFSDYVTDAIIQEFLPGQEVTTDVVCDLEGEVLAVVSRQRIEVRAGEVAKGVTVYEPDIEAVCRTIARALPAIGPITVQCIFKDSRPCLTEINARIGGGFPLGIMAGSDSLKVLLSRIAGVPFDHHRSDKYVSGLYCTRYDDAFFLSQEDHERLARRHF